MVSSFSRSAMKGNSMKIKSATDFGLMIKKRRKDMGYTQAYLAEFTGLSASFISNLENGKETAEIGKALFLCNLLGINLEMEYRGE